MRFVVFSIRLGRFHEDGQSLQPVHKHNIDTEIASLAGLGYGGTNIFSFIVIIIGLVVSAFLGQQCVLTNLCAISDFELFLVYH